MKTYLHFKLIFFANHLYKADGAIQVTGSHNPKDYNGLKMVKAGAAPLDFEHFCSTGGHVLVETRSEGKIFTFCICVGTGPGA